MGSARTFATSTTVETAQGRTWSLGRVLDVVVGVVLLLAALPLLALLALAVRTTSHGPVFRRTRARDRRGRPVELLAFRTTLDGAGTVHHERVRAVVGASEADVVTGVGRVIRAVHLERLPRLINVVRGHTGLFA